MEFLGKQPFFIELIEPRLGVPPRFPPVIHEIVDLKSGPLSASHAWQSPSGSRNLLRRLPDLLREPQKTLWDVTGLQF